MEASSDALVSMLFSSDDVCSNVEEEADAVPSFRPVTLRPPRRVRLRLREEEAALSRCLPPCSGRVGRVSRRCWDEEDEAEAEAATAAWVLWRPSGAAAATQRGAAAVAAPPPTKEPKTRDAPRAACRGAIGESGFGFLAERERAG